MLEDIATVVESARAKAFVGRTAEIARFRAALDGSDTHRVLFVHGVGGLGKTALLQQLRAAAGSAGVPVVAVDGEDVGSSAEVLQAAVDAGRPAAPGDDQGPAPWVLMIDGYERLAAIDRWVREGLVGSLPAAVVVVICGREPPTAGWCAELGWRSVVRPLALPHLDAEQSRLLLERAGVAEADRVRRLAALGHGHPLTLAMLAAAVTAGTLPDDLPDDLSDAPDVVAVLTRRLVDEAPDDDHGLAVALCAHAWLTTQDLIDDLLGRDAPEVWRWLESRPWVTRGTYGIYPHDLVRDLLSADLRRRSPAVFRRVHRFIHQRSWAAMHAADDTERRLWAHQKLFLHRQSPLASSFWTLRENGTIVVSAGRAADHQPAAAMVERFQGAACADLARRWFEVQPENLAVIRSASGLEAFVFHAICPGRRPTDDDLLRDDLPRNDLLPDDVPRNDRLRDDVLHDDRVTLAALDHAGRTSPARPGELISVARFLGGRTGDQRDPYAVVVGCVSSTMLWTTQPLAWSFVTTPDSEFWTPALDYLALARLFDVDDDGLRYTVYGIDWRRLTPERWFELMCERELTGQSGPPPASLLRPAPLGREAFDAAVKAALRELPRIELLRASPLLGTRLAAGVDASSAEQLRATLLAGVEQLTGETRTHHLGRVLDRTYVHATATQEAAAEVLDLPFSTYRRHLARGIERLADLLWSVEIGERPPLQLGRS